MLFLLDKYGLAEAAMDFLVKIWKRICDFTMEYVVSPISKMDFKDVIDILVLAFLIYSLYKFFRKRRAGRMLMGLVVITAASILIDLIGFPALSYLVRLFAGAAFFCVIVIFQPEFRDTLEHIGNFSFLNPGKNGLPRKHLKAARAVTDEVVDAVFAMSESRTGALIVFEGLTKLGDFIHTGKSVDAAISSTLLQNIFYDKAPLHDGALIIRDMRILAASCVLPSSKANMDFGNMGTRHRAAVGITEVSDALVIVVSEQTGTVSVAQNGKLLRHLDAETLKDILLTYIAGNSYLRAKRVAAEERFQSVIDERWQDMMNASRAREQAAAENKNSSTVSATEEPCDEGMPEVASTEKVTPVSPSSALEEDTKL